VSICAQISHSVQDFAILFIIHRFSWLEPEPNRKEPNRTVLSSVLTFWEPKFVGNRRTEPIGSVRTECPGLVGGKHTFASLASIELCPHLRRGLKRGTYHRFTNSVDISGALRNSLTVMWSLIQVALKFSAALCSEIFQADQSWVEKPPHADA
jgi:hypothetical protein